MLGHELRNPLAPILTALAADAAARRRRRVRAERSDHRAPGPAPGAARRRSARRLAHHARQDRAAPRAGSSSPTWSRAALEMASPLLEQRQHQLDRRRAAPGCWSTAIRRGWRRSREPAHQRGEVHRAGRRIEVTRRARRTTRSVLACRDNGIGIAPEMLPQRVRPVRAGAPGARRARRAGLGLGLAIVAQPRRAARRHGRRPQRRARPGQRVRGPAAGGRRTQRPRRRVAAPSRVRKRRAAVLVVDDNDDAAGHAALDCVEALGYSVATAHDGPTALDRRARFRPDIACSTSGCR